MAFEWKDMRKWGSLVGREGMSQAAIKAVEEFDGSYKGAMELAGRMMAIAQAAKCDDYWSEKVVRGYSHQLWLAQHEVRVSASRSSVAETE
ncbi:MAG: hypothetical protein Unbinned7865contig1001_17 [Prokaryotic dsDNA virus sp.]|nr:MAG: hypothetical protein Unbinned7865contig1001_17 [Prokaryotic dsDNA virus sp.]|tara:strand:- start:25814 stop:26086 length:273 start_codon:yes stop_codon:yes gene_type:complete